VRISDKMLRQNAARARELWLDTLPGKDELPAYPVSPELQEKMDGILARARRFEKRKAFFRSFSRVAVLLLLVSALTFTGAVTVSASFREKVMLVFSRVFSDHTEYGYTNGQEGAALPELRLDALPEGFTVLSDEQSPQSDRHIRCKNDAGNYLDIDVFVISANGSGTQLIDSEDAQVSVLDIQGREVTVVSKYDWHILLWTEDSTVITVESNIELQEIIAFVEKITTRK